MKTVRELIYKRGYGKINKQRIPLSSNAVIEGALGQYGIISIEDIVHEISTAGPHFKQVSKYVSSPDACRYRQPDADFSLLPTLARVASCGLSSSPTRSEDRGLASSRPSSREARRASASTLSTRSSGLPTRRLFVVYWGFLGPERGDVSEPSAAAGEVEVPVLVGVAGW